MPRPAANCQRNRLFDIGVAQSPLRGVLCRQAHGWKDAGQVDAVAELVESGVAGRGLEGELPSDAGDLHVPVVAVVPDVRGQVRHVLDVPPDARRGDDPGAGVDDPGAVFEPLDVRVRLLDADREP